MQHLKQALVAKETVLPHGLGSEMLKFGIKQVFKHQGFIIPSSWWKFDPHQLARH